MLMAIDAVDLNGRDAIHCAPPYPCLHITARHVTLHIQNNREIFKENLPIVLYAMPKL